MACQATCNFLCAPYTHLKALDKALDMESHHESIKFATRNKLLQVDNALLKVMGIKFCLFSPLFDFLLLHPTDEERTSNYDVGEIRGNPHNQAAQLLVGHRRNSPYTRRIYIRSV